MIAFITTRKARVLRPELYRDLESVAGLQPGQVVQVWRHGSGEPQAARVLRAGGGKLEVRLHSGERAIVYSDCLLAGS